MSTTLDDVSATRKQERSAEARAAEELVRAAREQGLSLTGPGGLLKQLTKTVLETALNGELTEHLGHDKHGRADPESGNIRNGTRPKTVLTESGGEVQIEVPRDRAGTFEPQIVRKRQRRNAWQEFIPFLDYDVEIRQVICTTNAIESLNARYRRAVKARGHFPTEQAALKCLYLVTRSLDATGTGRTRWAMRWKPAINAFAITFGDRFPAGETY
jgi:transposase-like protein